MKSIFPIHGHRAGQAFLFRHLDPVDSLPPGLLDSHLTPLQLTLHRWPDDFPKLQLKDVTPLTDTWTGFSLSTE